MLPEELLKLQHKVRVLEKSLHSEQRLSQEMHAALCQREQEYCELGELLPLSLHPSLSLLLHLTPSLLIPFNFFLLRG